LLAEKRHAILFEEISIVGRIGASIANPFGSPVTFIEHRCLKRPYCPGRRLIVLVINNHIPIVLLKGLQWATEVGNIDRSIRWNFSADPHNSFLVEIADV